MFGPGFLKPANTAFKESNSENDLCLVAQWADFRPVGERREPLRARQTSGLVTGRRCAVWTLNS